MRPITVTDRATSYASSNITSKPSSIRLAPLPSSSLSWLQGICNLIAMIWKKISSFCKASSRKTNHPAPQQRITFPEKPVPVQSPMPSKQKLADVPSSRDMDKEKSSENNAPKQERSLLHSCVTSQQKDVLPLKTEEVKAAAIPAEKKVLHQRGFSFRFLQEAPRSKTDDLLDLVESDFPAFAEQFFSLTEAELDDLSKKGGEKSHFCTYCKSHQGVFPSQ